MLADNIKKYRKAKNMTQDELAQNLYVSRQSVSLWENGQSQPTIDNIIALTKIFGVSADELLGNSADPKEGGPEGDPAAPPRGKKGRTSGLALGAVAVVVVIALIVVSCTAGRRDRDTEADSSADTAAQVQADEETAPESTPEAVPEDETPSPEPIEDSGETDEPTETTAVTETQSTEPAQEDESTAEASAAPAPQDTPQPQESTALDLFTYCKEFAIEKGALSGDHCLYQQPSVLYGGYEGEYFSISYWGDSDMVEFCLHCPLSDTQSINFYLRMRGGYDGQYEYLTSKYYRSDGTSIRYATGYIDPATFTDHYPLSCDYYEGGADGQDDYMEESRVGMCDLIRCLKQFVTVEGMACQFSDFGFVNF